MNTKEYLNHYTRSKFSIIPIPFKAKGPVISKWETRTPEDFDPTDFEGETNVGIVLGQNSGGLVDIDLDCEEAIAIAAIFLPPTNFKFGRASKPLSHYFYRCTNPGRTVRFKGIDGRTLVECRGTGGQTVVPPSVHETGELIEFSELGEPAEADFNDLLHRCQLMRVAVELAPHWKEGSRHDLSLAVSGSLLRAGLSLPDVSNVIRALCKIVRDDEVEDRIRSIETTANKLVNGESTTGWPSLVELVGQTLVNHIGKWLGADSHVVPVQTKSAFPGHSLNDAGNAKRTAMLFGNDLIYVPQLRRFFCWQDGIWIEDTDNLKTSALCLDSVDHYLRHPQVAQSDDEKLVKFLRGSKNHGRLNAQLGLLRSMVACDLKELDSNEHLVGCLNGMIDLDTGSFLPPDRSARITKRLNAVYDPEADCPHFKKLIHDMLGGDEDKIAYVQKLAGYWLTGSTKYHLFPILVGDAACGKSKFVNAISAVLGDYATQMMADTLFEQSSSCVSQYDLATFRGRRFVVAQEAESQERLKATTIKALTGEDTIKVRLPYQDPWPLPPGAKFLMVANRRPNVDPFDTGLRRRIVIIECAAPLPQNERDADLGEKLAKETSGILNWMLEGWAAVKKGNLYILPPALEKTTDQFFHDKNEIDSFFDECVEKASGLQVSVADFYDAYCKWCAMVVIEPRSQAEFARLLRTNKQLEQGRTNSKRYWKGLKVRENAGLCTDAQDHHVDQFLASSPLGCSNVSANGSCQI
jgi:putative DNA primase/helicase